jgi:hypothetical protein
MSNVLELLLQSDPAKIRKPTKEVEIKRLSEAVGQKVVFTCQAIDISAVEYIQENAVKDDNVSMSNTHIFTVIEGVKEPSLKNKDLLKKYNAATPKDLLAKGDFLLPGEVQNLYYVINQLSGYNDGAVEEVKNSQRQMD